MPQHEAFHNVVKQALIKDGWTITDDPFILEFKGLRLYADLGAEKTIAAEKLGRKVAIEIKVFGSLSLISELEKAVGQYGIYRTLLKRINPERLLYLAISQEVFQDFFQRPAIQEIVVDQQIRLLVFDAKEEEIVQWINYKSTEISFNRLFGAMLNMHPAMVRLKPYLFVILATTIICC